MLLSRLKLVILSYELIIGIYTIMSTLFVYKSAVCSSLGYVEVGVHDNLVFNGKCSQNIPPQGLQLHRIMRWI